MINIKIIGMLTNSNLILKVFIITFLMTTYILNVILAGEYARYLVLHNIIIRIRITVNSIDVNPSKGCAVVRQYG